MISSVSASAMKFEASISSHADFVACPGIKRSAIAEMKSRKEES